MTVDFVYRSLVHLRKNAYMNRYVKKFFYTFDDFSRMGVMYQFCEDFENGG